MIRFLVLALLSGICYAQSGVYPPAAGATGSGTIAATSSLLKGDGSGAAVAASASDIPTLTASKISDFSTTQSGALTGDVTKSAGAGTATVVGLNGTALSSLATGILKNTTSTGVPSVVTAPTGTIVGTSDTQTLTNKTVNGVTPTTFGFLDPTSSIQTQINGKAGFPGAGVAVSTGSAWGTSLTAPAGAIVGTSDSQTLTGKSIDAGQLTGSIVAGRLPALTGDATTTVGTVAVTVGKINGTSLAGLATGILKNTTTTGVPSIAAAGTDYTAPIASGTAALGTSAIASGACATVVTVAGSGIATTDILTTSFNGDPTAVTGYGATANGMLTIIPYPTSGNANFKVCNNTAASITPGAITLNWKVVR